MRSASLDPTKDAKVSPSLNLDKSTFSNYKARIQPGFVYAGKRLEEAEGEGLKGLEGARLVLIMSSKVMKWVVWGKRSTGWTTVGRKGSPWKLLDVARPRSTKFLGKIAKCKITFGMRELFTLWLLLGHWRQI